MTLLSKKFEKMYLNYLFDQNYIKLYQNDLKYLVVENLSCDSGVNVKIMSVLSGSLLYFRGYLEVSQKCLWVVGIALVQTMTLD